MLAGRGIGQMNSAALQNMATVCPEQDRAFVENGGDPGDSK